MSPRPRTKAQEHLKAGYIPPSIPAANPDANPAEEAAAAAVAQIQLWRADPELFARQVFRFRPSNQQRDFFLNLGRLVAAKCAIDEGREQQLSEEDRNFARYRGISIRSGKGTGKDAVVSIVVWWFLVCFHESKTFLIAPSLENLRSNLIAEMSKWLTRRDNGEPICLLKDQLELMANGARLRQADPETQKNWFVSSQTAGPNLPEDKQLEVFQGKHARYMMFVCDEASGIPDPVFRPLDTTLTDPVNFILLLWNPTRRTGFAYNTHFGDERKYWINLHWDAEQSDLITPDQITYLRDKYGEDSMEYRVSVKGEPPAADSDALIPYEWCQNARELELTPINTDPIIFGVDVARQGADSSVIIVRQGPVVLDLTELNQLDTVQLAQWVSMKAADWEPEAIYIDAAGIGVGVYDELKRMGVPGIFPVNVANAARQSKFVRLRDELWWSLRQRFEGNQISLFRLTAPQQLIAELSGIKFAVNDKGKIKVESKIEMKKRNMPSPNQADALMLTCYANDRSLSAPRKLQQAEADREAREEALFRKKARHGRSLHWNSRTWMGK